AQPPPTIGFSYWLVIGKKSKDAGAVPADLSEIAPALQAIQKSDGPVSFSSFEKLTLLSQSDESAEQQSGRHTFIRQRATLHEKNVIADLKLQNGGQQLETRVQIAPGQLLVLGQSGWAGSGPGPAPDDSTLYWIARADVK